MSGIGSRGGAGIGNGCGGGTSSRGGSGGGGGGGRSPSPIFREQPLEREITHFFLQMMSRVCGRVPSPLIDPKMA